MSPDTTENISSIISSATDMSDRPRDVHTENMNALPNYIYEPPKSFTRIFKPFNGVRTIEFNQKVTRGRPLRSRRNQEPFPNSNNSLHVLLKY